MRASLLLAIVFCLSTWVLAADWGTYEDTRYGYVFGVPPGFAAIAGRDDGAGHLFASVDGTQRLRTWGGSTPGDGYEATVAAIMDAARAAGWLLSGDRVAPAWAGWAGRRNGMRLEARMIALCEGRRYAAVEIVYPERALHTAGPVAERLARSLAAAADARC